MVLSLFSLLLFPVTGIVAVIKMSRAQSSDYSSAKKWTITSYALFAILYVAVLIIVSIHFVKLLS